MLRQLTDFAGSRAPQNFVQLQNSIQNSRISVLPRPFPNDTRALRKTRAEESQWSGPHSDWNLGYGYRFLRYLLHSCRTSPSPLFSLPRSILDIRLSDVSTTLTTRCDTPTRHWLLLLSLPIRKVLVAPMTALASQSQASERKSALH